MAYDLVVLDDNVGVHCPPHFVEPLHPNGILVGYGTSEHPNFRAHWNVKNPFVRRIIKLLFCIWLNCSSRRHKSILVYDDVVVAVTLRMIFGSKEKVSLRLTHLKDRDKMPLTYTQMVYSLLRRSNVQVFSISEMMKRYLSIYYGLDSIVWPSRAERKELQALDRNREILVYCGTLTGRNFECNFLPHMQMLVPLLGLSEVIVITPKISSEVHSMLTRGMQEIGNTTLTIIVDATQKEIDDAYSRAKYGYAFYDFRANSILRHNFPLKTLEYIAYGIVPIVNRIHSHRQLVAYGYALGDIDRVMVRLEDRAISAPHLSAKRNYKIAESDNFRFF